MFPIECMHQQPSLYHSLSVELSLSLSSLFLSVPRPQYGRRNAESSLLFPFYSTKTVSVKPDRPSSPQLPFTRSARLPSQFLPLIQQTLKAMNNSLPFSLRRLRARPPRKAEKSFFYEKLTVQLFQLTTRYQVRVPPFSVFFPPITDWCIGLQLHRLLLGFQLRNR